MEKPGRPDPIPLLLISIDPIKLEALTRAMREESPEITAVNDLGEALGKIASSRFAMIILDLELPGADPLSSVEKIRNAPGSDATPIVVINSSKPDESEVRRGYGLGIVDFLYLPLDAPSFSPRIRMLAQVFREGLAIREQEASMRRETSELRKSVDEGSARVKRVEEDSRLVYENIVDYAIFMLDPDGKISSWNPGAARVLGYPEEEILGRDVRILFTPEDLAAGESEKEIKSALDAGRAEDERWHVRKDGSRFWASGILTRVLDHDGKLRGYIKIMRDQTERQMAREKLQQSEERNRRLVEEIQDYAIVLLDPEGRVMTWNKGFERILGYEAAEILGQSVSIIYTPEDRALGKLAQELKTAVEQGRNKDSGWRVRKDGTYVWSEEIISPIRRDDGALTGFTKVIRDITLQKEVEEARASQVRYLEGMDGISSVLELNLDMEQVLQLAVEKINAIFGGDAAFLIHPLSRNTARFRLPYVAVKRAAGKGPLSRPAGPPSGPGGAGIVDGAPMNSGFASALHFSSEPILIDRDNPIPGLEPCLSGSGGSLAAILIRPKIGEPWALSVVHCAERAPWPANDLRLFKDIGLRLAGVLDNLLLHRNLKQAEEEVRRSRDQLDVILQGIADAILVYSPSGALVFSNQAAARMLEYPAQPTERRDEMRLEESLRRMEIMDESGKPMPPEQTPLRQALKGLETPPTLLRYRLGSEGQERWLITRAKPILDNAGRVRMVISISQDTTELRKAEEQFRQSQKMEAVGRLAGGVAHDFNNLLTAINGYADLLLGMMEREDSRRSYLEEIRKAGDRAASLTNQLLVYSRRQILSPRAVNLNDVASQMETMLRRLIGEDIEFQVRLDGEIDTIKADPGQIEQVILNLVVNARDAMPKGGLLSLETHQVDMADEPGCLNEPAIAGQYVRLTVRDTGVGMEDSVKSRLFEPFFTTKKTGHGTGLGLSTVYGIVRQSGGCIGVESEKGKGTAFKVYFPAAGIVNGEKKIEESGGTGSDMSGTETILIAEDDFAVRSLVRDILKSHGYRVLEAGNGVEALEAANEYPGKIDLLLTDVIMAQMGGRELTDRMKLIRPDLKTIYMSGYTDDAVVRHGVFTKTEAFLQKPFTPENLVSKVRMVLDSVSA
ncbi:MAG: PAS domain S-box protein [Fibrobacteres bacterium]|nr:PAS domain S-box protein [Fibrobacterota bacterium]